MEFKIGFDMRERTQKGVKVKVKENTLVVKAEKLLRRRALYIIIHENNCSCKIWT